MDKKVAILGTAPSSLMKAPFDNKEFEIWGLNKLFPQIPRADRWFEMHGVEEHPEIFIKGYIEWLKTVPIPVYMQDRREEFPTSVKYPLQEIVAEFCDVGDVEQPLSPFFTCTASYMVALAIYEMYDEIHLYGIDMAMDTEYKEQRPSVEYFLGIAKGRGIKIKIPSQSDLLKAAYLYGYEDTSARIIAGKLTAREKELSSRLQEYQKQANELQAKVNYISGALEDCQYFKRVWR